MKRTRIRQQSSKGRLRRELYRDVREECARQANWCCEVCGSPHYAECHHVIGRRVAALHNHPLNLILLCRQCHRQAHDGPTNFKTWFTAHYGPGRMARLLELRRLATSWRR